jgi:putative phage-type endonuclease
MEQGCPAWQAWRRGGIGSGDAGAVMGVSPWQTSRQLWEVLTGRALLPKPTYAMRRGLRLEPVARRLYERRTGRLMEPCCVLHERYDWLRASLDGLDLEGELVLEVKAPDATAHRLALSGEVPAHYRPQVQHQLLVTGGVALALRQLLGEPDFHNRGAAGRGGGAAGAGLPAATFVRGVVFPGAGGLRPLARRKRSGEGGGSMYEVEVEVVVMGHNGVTGLSRVVSLPFVPQPGMGLCGITTEPDRPEMIGDVAWDLARNQFRVELVDCQCPEESLGELIDYYGPGWQPGEPTCALVEDS